MKLLVSLRVGLLRRLQRLLLRLIRSLLGFPLQPGVLVHQFFVVSRPLSRIGADIPPRSSVERAVGSRPKQLIPRAIRVQEEVSSQDLVWHQTQVYTKTKGFSGLDSRLRSFHEKAAECQVFPFIFSFLLFFFFSQIFPIEPSRLCRHPSFRTRC